MTLDQINSRLEELKTQKNRVEGVETEVYARIVGYYRSVRNWNKGKKEEYGVRRNFSDFAAGRGTTEVSPASELRLFSPKDSAPTDQPEEKERTGSVRADDAQHELGFGTSPQEMNYLYFFRKTCPNCPPVAAWLEGSPLAGRHIDVDRESGMLEAARYFISTAPTVVMLDGKGNETGRGSSVAALESLAGVASVSGA